MNAKAFFDTNIIVYLYSTDEPQKRSLIESLLVPGNIYISTQVINEFLNVMIKKKKIEAKLLKKVVDELTELFQIALIDGITIRLALQLMSINNYSYFDSLMIASAIENNCKLLYTEDMHHHHIINDSTQLINPFENRLF